MKQAFVKLAISLGCVLFVLSFNGCKTPAGGILVGWGPESKGWHPTGSKTVVKGGPPTHAPAHGYRAKYSYRYYPSGCVYFDASRKVYFYVEGNNWTMSVSLPQEIQLRLGSYVSIELDTDRPYIHFEEHKRRYPPPGQLKKKNKKWVKY
ncbi:MAG: hypothetical protein KAU38_05930 [Desulfobacterales bacterium]|nr:hypothetical protein [Desulfobacterales bacterium]